MPKIVHKVRHAKDNLQQKWTPRNILACSWSEQGINFIQQIGWLLARPTKSPDSEKSFVQGNILMKIGFYYVRMMYETHKILKQLYN